MNCAEKLLEQTIFNLYTWTKYLCVLIHIWIKGEVGAVKLV